MHFGAISEKGGFHLELNKRNFKCILLLVLCAILLYWGLNNLSALSAVVDSFFSLLAPLLLGICVAYVVNLLLKVVERLWDKALAKAPEIWRGKLKRPICLTLTMLLFLGIIFAIIFILIPRLEEAGATLVANVPGYVDQLQSWWNGVIAFAAERGVTLPELSMNADNATKVLKDFLTNNGDNVVNTTLDITTSILGALVNFLLALVFSVYLLAQKEKLLAQSKRLLLAAIPQKVGKRTMHILKITNNAFSSFVTGQVTEAFILGTLCCMGMLILRLPYALPVSVIICFTSPYPHFRRVDRRGHRGVPYCICEPHQGSDLPYISADLAAGGRKPDLSQGGGQVRGPAGAVGPGSGDHRRRCFRHCGDAPGRADMLGGLCAGAGLCPLPACGG